MATLSLSTSLPRDANNQPIQSPASLQFSDATGTPITSPRASVGTSGQAFVVPTGAVSFSYTCSAATFYSAESQFDSSHGYNAAAANTVVSYPCANMAGSSIYVAAQSGTVTVYFHFEMLG